MIDTIGKKGVLLLGRFTKGRIQVLERLREKLRSLGFVPMVFNFDKPEAEGFHRDGPFAGWAVTFVIVGTSPIPGRRRLSCRRLCRITWSRSSLYWSRGRTPLPCSWTFATEYDWVLKPVIGYPSIDRLIEVLEQKVVGPAEVKFNQLLARRHEQLRVENV